MCLTDRFNGRSCLSSTYGGFASIGVPSFHTFANSFSNQPSSEETSEFNDSSLLENIREHHVSDPTFWMCTVLHIMHFSAFRICNSRVSESSSSLPYSCPRT